jgi:hypothetical protein
MTVFPEKQREPHTFEPEVLLRQQEQQLHRVQLQLSQLLALHTPTTSEAGTNTGVSLLLPNASQEVSNGSSAPQQVSNASSVAGEVSNAFSVVGGVSGAIIVPEDVTVRTETSIQASQPIGMDLCSFADGGSMDEGGEAGLLHRNRQQFYQNMLAQVQELLETSPTGTRSSRSEHHKPSRDVHTELSTYCHNEVSTVPVPHILNTRMESTVDESTHAADMIALKYMGHTSDAPSLGPAVEEEDTVIKNQMSIATDSYLHRHRLLPRQQPPQILDVSRLRTLTKLI